MKFKLEGKHIGYFGIGIVILWLANWLLIYFFKDYGQIGDVFGVANSLFTGFALLGVIYSISLQSKALKHTKKALKLTRIEMKATRAELKNQKEEFKITRMTNVAFEQVKYLNEELNRLIFQNHGTGLELTLYKYSHDMNRFHNGLKRIPIVIDGIDKNIKARNNYIDIIKYSFTKSNKSISNITYKIDLIFRTYEEMLTDLKINETEALFLKRLLYNNTAHSAMTIVNIIDIYKDNDTINCKETEDVFRMDRINYIKNYYLPKTHK